MNVFEASAAELRRLHENVHTSFSRRNESPRAKAAWQEAARIFNESFDRLAFPGGLDRQFRLLANGDPYAIEMAVRFLEADPWYFRSGYHKADLIRLLRKQPLSEDQRARLRQVIVDRVRGRPVREMRSYGRLALTVGNSELAAELANIAADGDRHRARHARWILQYLNVIPVGTK